MGEALISRAGGGEGETIVPITPGYHTILVSIKDPEGGVMANHPVTCTDGSRKYNYTTNSRGQAMFVCNSGAANIFVNNYNGAYRYLDIAAQWKNIDAPVGLSSKVEINLEHPSSLVEFLSSTGFEFYSERVCDIDIVGGGGGGGNGTSQYEADRYYYIGGGGGGAGYLNQYKNQTLKGIYNFISGAGGSPGGNWQNPNGSTGGTSYIVNTNYSAIGGAGGSGGADYHTTSGKWYGYICRGGSGGLGRGGTGWGGWAIGGFPQDYVEFMPTSSNVDFAGGGGGAGGDCYRTNDNYGIRFLGKNYGGNGSMKYTIVNGNYSYNVRAKAGTRGGGGGGGYSNGNLLPARGGSGLLRINIKYD